MGRDIVEIVEVHPRALVYVEGYRFQGKIPQNHLGPVMTTEELEAEGLYDVQELEGHDDASGLTAADLLAQERSRALEQVQDEGSGGDGEDDEDDEDDDYNELAETAPVELVPDPAPAAPTRGAGGNSMAHNVTVSTPAKHVERSVVENPTSAGRPSVSNTPRNIPGRARVTVSEAATRPDDGGAATASEPAQRDD